MAKLENEMNTVFANEKHKLLANTVYTGNWITRGFEKFIKEFGLSSQQFNILRILRGDKGWLSMHEIKQTMVEKSPNATRLCDKLVDKGWAERQRSDTDRRIVSLRISQKGLEILKSIDESDNQYSVDFLDAVTEEEAKIVNEILDKIRS